jgi:hypothetical protein
MFEEPEEPESEQPRNEGNLLRQRDLLSVRDIAFSQWILRPQVHAPVEVQARDIG